LDAARAIVVDAATAEAVAALTAAGMLPLPLSRLPRAKENCVIDDAVARALRDGAHRLVRVGDDCGWKHSQQAPNENHGELGQVVVGYPIS
jgi:hypothetical protein